MLIIASLLIFNIRTSIHRRVEQRSLNREWKEHKFKYNLEYSLSEDIYRKEIFTKNYQFIMKSNSKNFNFSLKMNMFGHLNENEMPKLKNLQKPIGHYEDLDPIFDGWGISSEKDWRQEGVVSPVRHQLTCTACYAFNTVGAIESYFAIHTGNLKELSVQELVDCSVSYGNNGCRGGNPENVYQYVWENGLSLSSDYPYTGIQGNCQRNNPNSSYKLFGYTGLKGGDEDNLLRALFYLGPIPIAMDANHQEFVYYNSGILDIENCNPANLNHAVLAVGYNLTETPYLIVKNSWGTNWGIDGYLNIALHRNNMCGIASWVTVPYIAVEYDTPRS